MSRAENISIFEDTRRICKSDPDFARVIDLSNERQRIILESDPVPRRNQIPRYDGPAKVIVSRRRTFEAAMEYDGYKACVLNFASATTPGGGVTWGSTAQEECLCRCSTLYANLDTKDNWERFYAPHRRQNNPLYNDDCIYTPNVLIFKSDTQRPEWLDANEWMLVNVLTCAAPNLRPDRDGNVVEISESELEAIHIKRIRRIVSIAAQENNEVLVLGAFGCGAFRNPPSVVARVMKKVVEEFQYHFRFIEFAVYCSPRDEQNYITFCNVFSE